MFCTGIVRRIDDLGRVVIPKEIRRSLNIKEGDPLEIYVNEDSVVYKKYDIATPALNAISAAMQAVIGSDLPKEQSDEVLKALNGAAGILKGDGGGLPDEN